MKDNRLSAASAKKPWFVLPSRVTPSTMDVQVSFEKEMVPCTGDEAGALI